jgi:uncharacterized protein YcaQ
VGSRSVIATYRASPSPVLADGCGVARQGDLEQLELFAGDKRAQADVMLRRIEAGGPLAASDVAISMAPKRHVVWSEAKHALEWLFWAGLVAATLRRVSFERVYDLLERVLPRAMLNAPTPVEGDARRALMARSAALGIGTMEGLRDCFPIPAVEARLAAEQLIEEAPSLPCA